MKKWLKKTLVASTLASFAFTLASCGGYNFYSDFKSAGAVIEKSNVFTVLTVDEVQEKISNKETFAVFFGSSTDSTTVSDVSAIQYDADVTNYTGKVYFVDTTAMKNNTTKQKDMEKKMKTNSLPTCLGCIAYVNGEQEFDTSEESNSFVEDNLQNSGSTDIHMIAAYVFLHYPVEK